jgi:hypothetical protein
MSKFWEPRDFLFVLFVLIFLGDAFFFKPRLALGIKMKLMNLITNYKHTIHHFLKDKLATV